jgi:hypothetical protein
MKRGSGGGITLPRGRGSVGTAPLAWRPQRDRAPNHARRLPPQSIEFRLESIQSPRATLPAFQKDRAIHGRKTRAFESSENARFATVPASSADAAGRRATTSHPRALDFPRPACSLDVPRRNARPTTLVLASFREFLAPPHEVPLDLAPHRPDAADHASVPAGTANRSARHTTRIRSKRWPLQPTTGNCDSSRRRA